jgi:hypothetical protein
MRSSRLRVRTQFPDHFDSFIHMTFPISHADWVGESPQKCSVEGEGWNDPKAKTSDALLGRIGGKLLCAVTPNHVPHVE